MPLEHCNQATYGNRDVKSLVEHFSNNYLTEEEETSIIFMWPALRTRLVRQKAISPNDVFSNLLASRTHDTKDCLVLLDLVLTSTPLTAKCEPGFSATKHFKCNLRTTLGQNTLSGANALFRPCNEGLKTKLSHWFSGAKTKRHLLIFKLTTGIPKLSANLLMMFIPGISVMLAVTTRNRNTSYSQAATW